MTDDEWLEGSGCGGTDRCGRPIVELRKEAGQGKIIMESVKGDFGVLSKSVTVASIQWVGPVRKWPVLSKSTSFPWWFTFTFTLLHLVSYLLLCVDYAEPAPVSSSRQKPNPSPESYLLRFGYLPQSAHEMRDLITDKRLEHAFRTLQKFAKINVTGKLDEDTRRLMQKPRCGVPDILPGQYGSRRKRFTVQGQKWDSPNITWSLKKSASRIRDKNAVFNELEKALNVWSKATDLHFYNLRNPQDADEAQIRVVFERGYHNDGYPFDGKGSILAHAFFPGTGQGGDAHFDDEEIWIINSASHTGEGTRLFFVAAHEFGHSLGLSHSDVRGALMNPWYQSLDETSPLHEDDKRGIQAIYGKKNSGMVPNPYPFPRPTPRPRPEATTSSPKHRLTPHYVPPEENAPKTCDTNYDAITIIRSELFIFKGLHFWRLNTKQLFQEKSAHRYPSKILAMWKELPHNMTHIDAVYERDDKDIIFFIGKNYYQYDIGRKVMRGPKPLTSMRISPDVEKIDGAMTWGHNGKTYLFSGKQYWRLDDTNPNNFTVEPDYPRDMFVWKGVPYNIDSVLKWTDNTVYFFKGKVFWKFDDKHMRVASETPSLSAPFWMGCTSQPIPPNSDNEPSSVSALPVIKFSNLFLLVVSSAYMLTAYCIHIR